MNIDRYILPSQREYLKEPDIHAGLSEWLAESSICEVYSSEFAEEFVILVWLHGDAGISRMVLEGVVGLPIAGRSYVRELGQENCIERFGLDPLATFSAEPLSGLSLTAYNLLVYLGGLVRKRVFSVKNTPKSVARMLPDIPLRTAYEELEQSNLLISVGKDSWSFVENNYTQSILSTVVAVRNLAAFLIDVERCTRYVRRDINTGLRFEDFVLMFSQVEGRETHPCPICSKVPNFDHYITPSKFSISPFHYCVGPNRVNPYPIPWQSAEEEFKCKELKV